MRTDHEKYRDIDNWAQKEFVEEPEKAALRQRLADIAAGAGGSPGWYEDGLRGECLHYECLALMSNAIHRRFGVSLDERLIQSHTLDTLTDKLWEMGVRA